MKSRVNYLVKILFSIILIAQFSHGKDPLNSPAWDETIKKMIGNDKFIFDDENIKVNVPAFADNPLQVPIFIDATKIKNAKRLLVFADINAIVEIADFNLQKMKPILSLNIKVAQGTPLRAAILDESGLWHIGSANINSFGGGCSVASVASEMENYEDLLGKIRNKTWKKNDSYRIKWSIFHPMDTGLFVGNPAFYISDIKITSNNEDFADLKIWASVSENPRILFETKNGNGKYEVQVTDTDGNEFSFKTKI